MNFAHRLGQAWCAGLALIMLAGCQTAEDLYSQVRNNDGRVGPCPDVVVLNEAKYMATFAPQGAAHNPANVAYEGDISVRPIRCVYFDDNSKVAVIMRIEIEARKGPAAQAEEANFPFFVGLIGARNDIQAKQIFDRPVTFEDGRRATAVSDDIQQIIRLAPNQVIENYQVYVGFQLSPAQHRYNLSRRG